MADETKDSKKTISSIVAYQSKIIQHQEETIKLQKQMAEELSNLQDRLGNIEDTQSKQGMSNIFQKDAVRKLQQEVNNLKKQLKSETDRANAAANCLDMERTFSQQIQKSQKEQKEEEEARRQGKAEKRLKRRMKFIEYVHNYLNNPNLNKGDNLILMPQIVVDLHISDRTAIQSADDIRNGLVDCGYEDVKNWAKKKNRFKKKI